MTYVGKADALIKLGRVEESETLVRDALAEATQEGSAGYRAEPTMRLALIAEARKQPAQALQAMERATTLARDTGTTMLVANTAIEHARALRTAGRTADAAATLAEGVQASRAAGERLVLPRLLAQLADLRLSTKRHSEASELLQEADDLLEGRGRILASAYLRGVLARSCHGSILSTNGPSHNPGAVHSQSRVLRSVATP